MTITVSETRRLANGAERWVWQALIDQLEPGDLVVPGKRVTHRLKDREIEFFVAIEGAGMICVEVKGRCGTTGRTGGSSAAATSKRSSPSVKPVGRATPCATSSRRPPPHRQAATTPIAGYLPAVAGAVS